MKTHGLELCDVGLGAAVSDGSTTRVLNVPGEAGATGWPGFASYDGTKYAFGQPAEDEWFVHPRRVAHTFWSKLNHEASSLAVLPRSPSFSELSFFFLREFTRRLASVDGPAEQVVLAVPGSYLKDPITEEEKVGLVLGMSSELKLPLAGIIDLGCAALCDPRSPGFNPARPVLLVDVHLHAAELSVYTTEAQLERRAFHTLPQIGLAELLKHLTSSMGNRFLRQTAFDILEDGRIEQGFFAQTKAFLTSGAAEHRYHINTVKRGYDMLAKRDQLATDAQSFVGTLVTATQRFGEQNRVSPAHCTLALTDRASCIPQLEARLRALGFNRMLHLSAGAAAAGAAAIGARRLKASPDLADVPVEKHVPLSDAQQQHSTPWHVSLHKSRSRTPRPAPTHAIAEGIGHVLRANDRFLIATSENGADLPLPEAFNAATHCAVPLIREGGRWWFSEPPLNGKHEPVARVAIESGDHLALRCGEASIDIIFAHCRNGETALG